METFEAIKTRASIRKFLPHKMSKEEIEKILDAGFSAPSAMNRRPYELLVNTDNEVYMNFVEEKPTCAIIKDSSLSILIIGDSNKNPTNEFMVEDCSCIAQNMMLEATELGYGSLWAGIKYDSPFQKKLVEFFSLPDGLIPVALIAIGKPGERKIQPKRYDPKKVHFKKY
ncbi:MAG: nitroreductase family protein [Bacilli bacterium]|nr:nitroreductase family protein [Bacilli bacterium]